MISNILEAERKLSPWEMVYELLDELRLNYIDITDEEWKRLEEITKKHIEYNDSNAMTNYWIAEYKEIMERIDEAYYADEILIAISRIITNPDYSKIIECEYDGFVKLILRIFSKTLERL